MTIQKVLVDDEVREAKLVKHHKRFVVLVILGKLLISRLSRLLWLNWNWLLLSLVFGLWDELLVRILEWLSCNLIRLVLLLIFLWMLHFFHVYIAPDFWAEVLTIDGHDV